ncbi:MAG: NHL repeat-containing protein [Candidatus Erginobacter occultus]|nr:NHL repeat-containing protein [Candidatus Erginobacter occultus]
MNSIKYFTLLLLVLLAASIGPVFPLSAFENNQSAILAIGQPDLTSNNPNRGPFEPVISPGADTLWWPGGLQIYQDKLFVADYLNHRVLIFDPLPDWNNATAQVVIGQPDMISNGPNQDPTGGDPEVPYAYTLNRPDDVVISDERLVITDAENNRTLVFNSIPAVNNASGDVVIGQLGLSGNLLPNQGSGPADNTLYNPRRSCVDNAGRLIIADRDNNRVLIFDSIPSLHNAEASGVVGQPDFNSTEVNQGLSNPSAYTLHSPTGVFAAGGKLFITDTGNHRILIFNQIPVGNNASADVVLGQVAFDFNLPNQGQSIPDASTLSRPFGNVFSDGIRLFVTDNDNHRILIFQSIPDDMYGAPYGADVVIGQPDMYTNLVNQVDPDPPPDPPSPPGPNTLYWPDGVVLDGQNLYVSDTHNNRILIFREPSPSLTPYGYKTPTPSPTSTATPVPTSTPSPSLTPIPTPPPTSTPAPSPSLTPTPVPTSTPSPSLTPIPTPPPTSTPTPSPSLTLTPVPTVSPTPTSSPTPTVSPSPSPTPSVTPAAARRVRGDYDGDGTSDPAIFRPDTGLWAMRGVTRVYFGGSLDWPVPRDYSGDGTTDIGIFRPDSGLWAIKGVTRVYFGGSDDDPVPGYYTGPGGASLGIFRPATGLWALKGVTRIYYGGGNDWPMTGDFSGDGTETPGIFRPATGLWALRSLTRYYFGGAGDLPLTGDFSGDGTVNAGIFRAASGLWAVRGVTRVYFGGGADLPVPADFSGTGQDGIAVFRPAAGLWAARGVTRLYFGSSSDLPVVE